MAGVAFFAVNKILLKASVKFSEQLFGIEWDAEY